MKRLLVGVVVVAALTVTACGSDSADEGGGAASTTPSSTAPVETVASSTTSDTTAATQTSDATTTAPADLTSLVPPEIASRGVLNVGGQMGGPPVLYQDDSGKTAGLAEELMSAIAAKLGLTVEWTSAPYASAITSLQSDRLDAYTGKFIDTEEREQSVDFVDYFYNNLVLMVAAGNPQGITGLNDSLCGHTATAAEGASSIPLFQAQSDACKAAGKDPVELVIVPSQVEVPVQLKSGRADAMESNQIEALYVVQNDTDLAIAQGEPHSKNYAGLAVKKGNDQLSEALSKAVEAIIADGTYASILAKWNASSIAMTAPIMNGSTTQPIG